MGGAAALAAAGAQAQDAFETEDAQEAGAPLEQIVVTGSRIPRPDVVSNSPVNVISLEEIQRSAAVETEQVINALPQVVAGFGAQSNNPGNGTATVDLRNLGTVRTLVLMNGRRVVGSSNDGVVDLNMIPPALIERVEVVTGGASAVYGSDAMAGVVNFILKDNFEGFEAGAQYGITQHGDSDRLNLDFTAGGDFAGGRGNAVLYVNYFDRKQTLGAARDHASQFLVDGVDASGNPILVQGGNAVTPQGTIFAPGLVGLTDPYGDVIGTNGIFFADEGWRAYRTSDGYNDRPTANLQLPMERWQATSMFHYDLTSNVRAFGEVSFARTEVNSTLGALPMSSSGFIPGFQLDLRNPHLDTTLRDFLSANLDDNGDGFVPVNINRRVLESGPRTNDQTRTFWRFVGGLEGTFANGMNWDVYYNHGRSELIERQGGGVVIDRFAQMFLTDPADPFSCANGDPECVVINPFGLGSMTPEMVAYYDTPLTNLNTVEQRQVGASIAGPVFSLPAGDVGVALGVEYREEEAFFEPDNLYVRGEAISRSAGLQPTGGGYDVGEVFGEIYVPILSGRRGVDLLAFEGGVRFSNYSTAGAVTSYKYGGEYAPFSGLKFRGLVQRAVRAPNVTELFSGQNNTAPVATDFCNATGDRTAQERAFCIDLGVPASIIDVFQQENTQIRTLVGGNPDLNEETSDTWTVGFVYQPEFARNFQLTVDYYSIEIDNAIAIFGGGLAPTITACRADLSLNNPFCQPLTTRTPDGQLQDVPMLNQNIASISSRGVDFRVDYAHDLPGDWGDLSYFLAGAYLFENEFQGSPVVNPVDCAGYIVGGGCSSANPNWRFTQRLSWNLDDFTLSLRHRYIGSVDDGRIAQAKASGAQPPLLAVPSTPDVHYVDVSGSWFLNDQVSLYGGVDNLFDRDPPFLNERQTYDALGRRFTVGVRASF
jgi:iron complex outermembrane recepter protein